jgi:hypothetical protein
MLQLAASCYERNFILPLTSEKTQHRDQWIGTGFAEKSCGYLSAGHIPSQRIAISCVEMERPPLSPRCAWIEPPDRRISSLKPIMDHVEREPRSVGEIVASLIGTIGASHNEGI